MNDFTKEELELIHTCVESDYYHSNWSKSMYEPLINKIQSMIDNYCEHKEFTEHQSNCSICDNCHKVIG